MSKYTTQVRFICETAAGLEESQGYLDTNRIINEARDKIFDFDYPIFDESYRGVLENKILRHYYTREIGFETVGLWKHYLNMRLNEIMPYYNKMYNSELIEFNPMYDVDLTTDHEKTLNGTRNENGSYSDRGNYTENTSSNATKHTDDDINRNINSTDSTDMTNTLVDNEKNDHWDIYSDTPQGGLYGIRTEEYLTNARHITDDKTGSTSTTKAEGTVDTEGREETDRNIDSTENSTGNKTGNNTKSGNETKEANINDIEDYIQHIKGKTGGISFSKMLKEFRETFLNIDVEIINNLGDLFCVFCGVFVSV